MFCICITASFVNRFVCTRFNHKLNRIVSVFRDVRESKSNFLMYVHKYLNYARIALYTAGMWYLTGSLLFFVYLYKNKCSPRLDAAAKRDPSKTQSSLDTSKSSASKTLPIFVTVPSLSNSSITTQAQLESPISKVVTNNKVLFGSKPDSNIQPSVNMSKSKKLFNKIPKPHE